MRILLIEDEKHLSQVIQKGLIEQGYSIDPAFDGEEGLYLATTEIYDVLILDLMLPQFDGLSLCRELRRKGVTTPILMLTAKAQVEDKVEGLNAGADDYLTKPFEFRELKARVEALLRRKYRQVQTVIIIDDLKIDLPKRFVERGDKKITLTPKEFAILELLALHQNEVITRTQIIEHAWDYNFDSLSNVVDVFIATLRKKIDSGHKVKLISTIHGVGYRLGN